jgi:poly-gamma-glutamate synthesis protein (capsule biosynthesis protein)
MGNSPERPNPAPKLNRRDLLGKGTALTGSLLAGMAAQKKAAAQTPARPRTPDNEWNVVIAGETMAVRPFAMHTEPEFQGIVKLLKESDVTYAHLEELLGSSQQMVPASRGAAGAAGYLIAEPRIAEDLKAVGVDLMSLANNHSMDWGYEGIRSTLETFEKSGLTGAGIGRDLEEARAPGFCEKDKGRVALISTSAGNSAYEWAGLPKGTVPGRPGVNPFRATMRYMVDHETAAQFKAGAKKLGTLAQSRTKPDEFNITPGQQLGVTGSSGFTFVDGDKFEISTVGHQGDIEANVRSIKHARGEADLVIVAQHTSLSEGGRGDLPCKFAREFAKTAIDNGADIFVGHGWHKVLGIEIYKDKPIFHGLGNFFWQSAFIPRVPADEYEAYGYDVNQLPTLTPAVGPLHPAGDVHWAYSAIFQVKLVDGKLKEIRLHPVEMGWDLLSSPPKPKRMVGAGRNALLDGRPLLASGATGQWILERIAKLSATYGTKVEIQSGIGIVRV